MHKVYLITLAGFFFLLATSSNLLAADFHSEFTSTHDRIWIGRHYWANPMEDWRIQDGRLECITIGPNRNVHILTHQLAERPGTLDMSVRLGLGKPIDGEAAMGFIIGAQDEILDYRAAALRGKGITAGLTSTNDLFIKKKRVSLGQGDPLLLHKEIILRITAKSSNDGYILTLAALDASSGETIGTVSDGPVPAEKLTGNLALHVHHERKARGASTDPAPFWFKDWKISGSKVEAHPDRAFGPVLWAMHSLSNSRSDDGHVMKMTAQLPPLGEKDSRNVSLQTRSGTKWKTLGQAVMDPDARTATFRIPKWPADRDVSYRLVYTLTTKEGTRKDLHYSGTVRSDPVGRPLSIAAFTGNTDYVFPNLELARNVGIHDPDVLFFSGDQIYEGVGGYGIIRTPADRSILNYLRKWYLWGWAFGNLMRDRVTLSIPDDHDVYQGNIWGEGGRDCDGIRGHAKGGYAQHPAMVNAVNRTQTSHHPDFFDPTPIDRDISVFYGDMVYGRVSFAIVADRQFKSGPQDKVNTWKGRPDHVKDPMFDVKTLDKPGLKLLGDRQLEFLNQWAADWRGADMKIVLSQTIFCNLANYHGPRQEYIIADLDSNGWPQSGRNRALDAMRRGFALHCAGDQHLASIVWHGMDAHCDAGWSFCVPSIAAGYPRSWRPDEEGRPVKNRASPDLPDTGDYLDGFLNRITVYAVGNPASKNRPGRVNTAHDKASGYGLIRMNKEQQTITMECWRLQFDASNPEPGDQFPGWPKTISMFDNYGRKPFAYLPAIKAEDLLSDPVVQVINERTNRIEYTVRIKGDTFRPKVFEPSRYTIKVGNPDSNEWKIFKNIDPVSDPVQADSSKKLPNIIYILADDLGYGDLGCYGQKLIKTPNIDRLAAEGIRFTRHYSGSAVCAPSRCVLMTGLHTGHCPIRNNRPLKHEGNVPLPRSYMTLGTMMKMAGYATGAFGKWGLGFPGSEGDPIERGFDHFFGYNCQREAHDYYPDHLWRNRKKIILEGNLDGKKSEYSHDLITEEALSFIRKNRDQPFFAYIPYTIPHTRFQVPELGEYEKTDWDENQKSQAAMISRMDQDIGRIIDLIKKLGLEEETLILFSSDNGPHGGGGTLKKFNAAGALRARKGALYEGGIRVPLVARWPGKIKPGGITEHISCFQDIMPTFADLAGVKIDWPTDGLSFLPALTGRGEQKQHEYLYWELGGNQAVRMNQWKTVYRSAKGKKTAIELYDIEKDIGETKDLATQHPERVEKMKAIMLAARKPSTLFPNRTLDPLEGD